MPKAPTYSPTRPMRALRSPTRPMRALRDFQNGQGSLRSIAKRYGQGSLRSIAKRYGIPRATLQFKLKNPACKTAFGPSPVLTEVEENTIVRWITELAQKGFPRKKSDIISSVQQFLRQHPRPNLFKDNRPGEGWMKAFLKRHPEIVTRSPEPVTSARLPFAITSQKYKQMLEAKNEAKLSADKEKEKKRKEREEAKAAKAQKKMMKSVKSQLKCFICNRHLPLRLKIVIG
ncbi:Tc5 transposase DNA-binding domain [Popillia japonica]|uniref:Tc5 transposase DNA-binding domain n=1 Tax=Popillia japonica TaxID=7064 RepID=A0AAW1MP38_POPJA